MYSDARVWVGSMAWFQGSHSRTQAPVTWGYEPPILQQWGWRPWGLSWNPRLHLPHSSLGRDQSGSSWSSLEPTCFSLNARETKEPSWGVFLADFQGWLLAFCHFFQAWLTQYKIEGFSAILQREGVSFLLSHSEISNCITSLWMEAGEAKRWDQYTVRGRQMLK